MGRRRRRRRVDPADAARALPEAIAALSQTLPAGPSPETFRRAKFDRPEAAPAFWRLLFCVLSPQLPDGASASFSPEAQVRSVKLALRTQGYPRRALAQLPDDGSQGGRELLLALAWLLAREPLPERLLAQNRVQLGDEMHVCELLRRLQRENARLQAALEWRRRELVFWQWMMSVCPVTTLPSSWGGPDFSGALAFRKPGLCASLASRPTGDTVLDACPPEASQPTFLPRIPTPAAGALEPLVRELQALQGELREAVEARRAAWEAGVGGRGPEWSAARTALREAVGQDLAALRRACERGGSLAQPHGPRRLVRTEAGAPRGPGLRAPEVIEALRSREARLEVVLRRLQGQCRQELARLVGALPGLVWILPPGR
ncbi:tubulin epsilon and delta complex protein 1 isoform X6 [Balaenoptera musculus]|uniref:Tubulin epsilon and delta complex protein 1 isoform X6 n=1 Tax=Balaenoptera musculus TaxID=9771 RepID=A0A8B8WVJ8_BALMU|nr:tubulin epsilon and delta complex protein 1 isoform X6 [Balaenoptera musculus]